MDVVDSGDSYDYDSEIMAFYGFDGSLLFLFIQGYFCKGEKLGEGIAQTGQCKYCYCFGGK